MPDPIDLCSRLLTVSGPSSEDREYHRICLEIDRLQNPDSISLTPQLRSYLDRLSQDTRIAHYGETEKSHLLMRVEVYAHQYIMGLVKK